MRYQPMLACPVTEFPTSGRWCVQPKIDGWRCLVYVTKDGVLMFTRNGNRCDDAVPYVTDALRGLVEGTVLDGELFGGTFGHTQSVMTSGPHTPTDSSPAVEFFVFDILQVGTFPTSGLKLEERLQIVEGVASFGLPHVFQVPTVVEVSDFDAAHQKNLDLGFEGSMLKDLDSTYRAGRQKTWKKVKPTETDEARIVGFQAGREGIVGLVGALEIELESGVRTTISGFSLDLRLSFTNRPDDYLGRMVEFRHNGLWPSGSPRHPRWSRFRPDRD